MCGICGKINFNPDSYVEPDLINKMTSSLYHRGPDDYGTFFDKNIGLGHRRLKVIDLSTAGNQPMCNEDRTIWIIFNGEIYNFQELRTSLIRKGHLFKSKTDTEVIIHLYEDEGVSCLNYFRGMFALAIWDVPLRRLFLARDRLGKKPLVYLYNKDSFAFASEIKSLLCDPEVKKDVDYRALHNYLTYQYIPSPSTIFKDIKKLPPAHYILLKDGKMELKRYWQVNFQDKLIYKKEEEYKEHLLQIFEEAVRLRMLSDVPLGAFLSGGIDSSATVAMMSKLGGNPVKTFSIGFSESEYNELEYARIVAGLYKTDHEEFVVKPDAISILPKLIWHYNEPYADSSAIPSYYVSKLTRDKVTVALNGDGGDESFAGYERYIADRLANIYQYVPSIFREGIIKKLAYLIFPFNPQYKSFSRRLRRFLESIPEEKKRRYVHWLCFFNNSEKNELYQDEFKRKIGIYDSVDLTLKLFQECRASSFLDKTLFVDLNSYLPDDLLVKIDIASMAHSLETRSPFLDHKLVEFAASLPPSLKLKGLNGKYLLKKAFSGILPEKILKRKKMGFGVPLDYWFRCELKEFIHDILLGKRFIERGYFKKEGIEKLIREHLVRDADHSYKIWALVVLELWHQMFIDGVLKH
ncbi:MAG: asparagine synthase (glutamine-hydrolyzing) [Thermodesulfobacteriota bacterium]|nr:asparagine synthase (glutamine-hydrolyzing) [Thermodesulfobacteriota bacterium]